MGGWVQCLRQGHSGHNIGQYEMRSSLRQINSVLVGDAYTWRHPKPGAGLVQQLRLMQQLRYKRCPHSSPWPATHCMYPPLHARSYDGGKFGRMYPDDTYGVPIKVRGAAGSLPGPAWSLPGPCL